MTYKISKYNYITKIPDMNEWLLFNFYSQGLLKLDEEHKKKLDLISNNVKDIEKIFNEKEVTLLKNNGFIVEDNLNELYRIIYEYNKTYMHNKTLYLVILPTLACNFNCHYCYEGIKKSNLFIKDDIISKIGEFIKFKFQRNKNLREVHLHWFGGEPLIAMKEIKRIYKMISSVQKELRFELTGFITTNGFHLTENNIDLLNKYNVNGAMVSFDGPKDIHNKSRIHKNPEIKDTYSVILKNCIKFLRKDMHNYLALRIHLNYNNVNRYEEILLDFPEDIRGQISPLFTPIFGTEFQYDFDRYYSEMLFNAAKLGYYRRRSHYLMRKYCSCEFCSSLEAYLISADGNIYFCNYQNFTKKGLSKKLFLCHIDNYKNIEMQPNFYTFYGNYFFSKKNCLGCILVPICGGGCRVKDYQNINFIGEKSCPLWINRKKYIDKDILGLYQCEKIKE